MLMTSLAWRLPHDRPLGHSRPPLKLFCRARSSQITPIQVSET